MAIRAHFIRAAMTVAAAVLAGCALVPKPLTESEISMVSQDRWALVTASQEPVRGTIGLYEAMARALKYNLDHKVEMYQTTLRNTELNLARYDLLPDIVANSGYAGRDNFNASSSQNLVTGVQNFGASTSREKEIKTADIQFSWHILDFGLSFVRARQAADKVLIAAELRRKVANRIIEDVRTAFWRALSAQHLISKLNRLEGRTRIALANTRRLAAEKYTSPITSLSYERELIEIKRTIQELERDLSTAKQQLAALMNLQPDEKFTLVAPRSTHRALKIPRQVDDMIWAALQNRPELRELDYKLRINMHDAHAALLELLPGLQVYAGANFDSNDFLLHNDWVSWGAKASWNLIKVINYPARRAIVDARDGLLHQRALATSMAIMTQVHVSRVRFLHYRKELTTAREYLNVQNRLVRQIRAEAEVERIGEQTVIREEMNTLVAEVRRDIAYANLQNAYANVFASMGLDGYWSELDFETSVDELAGSLRDLWRQRAKNVTASLNQPRSY
ncbi:MAG: TolC family protein [Alphaproteobacteria bacterium]|nr:TolC family protein [Alphaproteobacteria bacterium]